MRSFMGYAGSMYRWDRRFSHSGHRSPSGNSHEYQAESATKSPWLLKMMPAIIWLSIGFLWLTKVMVK